MQYPHDLQQLIQALRRLPGVGTKTAERYAFHLLSSPQQHLDELSHLVADIRNKVRHCPVCGCILFGEACSFCGNARRDTSLMCLVASAKDVFALEQTGEYKGLYHVLGALLSPLDGIGPSALTLPQLQQRLTTTPVKEVVMALDSTLEGDTTALFLKKELAPYSVAISRLAFGIPMGSALDYVDGGTLALAFSGRRSY